MKMYRGELFALEGMRNHLPRYTAFKAEVA